MLGHRCCSSSRALRPLLEEAIEENLGRLTECVDAFLVRHLKRLESSNYVDAHAASFLQSALAHIDDAHTVY
jgi:hypothetical protein